MSTPTDTPSTSGDATGLKGLLTDRRAALGLGLAAVIAAVMWRERSSGGTGAGALAQEETGDFVLGAADAPVTLIEYASVTCVHCETFHKDVFPTLKEKYIDTGQMRFIFREFPTPPAQLAFAGFLLARCVERERYFDVLDVLFAQRAPLMRAAQQGGAREAYLRIARNAGLSEPQFDACLEDQTAIDAIYEGAERAQQDYDITGTPSFILDGVVRRDLRSLTDFEAAIEPLLGDAAAASGPAPEAAQPTESPTQPAATEAADASAAPHDADAAASTDADHGTEAGDR